MPPVSAKFNLPWNQYDQYWVCIYAAGGLAPGLLDALQKIGLRPMADGGLGMQTPRQWKPVWDKVYAALAAQNALVSVEASVVNGATEPAGQDRKSVEAMQAVSESLWLGEALIEGRIMCYLQPVVSTKDKVFGYESFARVQAENGVIAGDKIVAASKALGIEYMIDRHLQVQAINTFVTSAFNGFLFVNFFPGFIHRPAVYLEGLSETVKSFGIVAKNIVLDFTRSETPRDLAHLKSVCEYGRSRGYSIALDDIESVESARKLIGEIHPDFVKIGMSLVRRVTEPEANRTIGQIVELVHGAGGTVIGEGVETEEVHQALRAIGVNLFQGYLFSPPVPVEAALKKAL